MDAWALAQTGRWLIENCGYGRTKAKAVDGVAPEILADLMLTDPTKTLQSSFFICDMPQDAQTAYLAMVESIKAGG